jgi:hypothetical protein
LSEGQWWHTFQPPRAVFSATSLGHYLSAVYTVSEDHKAALPKQVSPVAWQHINLYGRYEFSKSPEIIDIEAILKDLSQAPMKPTVPV